MKNIEGHSIWAEGIFLVVKVYRQRLLKYFKFTLLFDSCAFHISESTISISYRFR
jgi:hypothetical protein